MENYPRIVLASASPRRADILRTAGIHFEVMPGNVDERTFSSEAPTDYIMRIARAKAVAAARQLSSGLVIGADTVVVLEGRLLGKPVDEAEATGMLRNLAARWHAVMTGVALYDVPSGRELVDYEKTLVRFAPLTEQEIDWYVATGEGKDKAGGYGIQGKAGMFVEEVAGNYFNVVGFPLPLVYRLARQLGYILLQGRDDGGR